MEKIKMPCSELFITHFAKHEIKLWIRQNLRIFPNKLFKFPSLRKNIRFEFICFGIC